MTYVDYETELSHPCDRGAFVTARGALKDAELALVLTAIKANFLATAPPDALVYQGSQRAIERLPLEDREQYRARLARTWEFWQWAGTSYGIQIALESIGLTDIDVVEYIDWNYDANTEWWARFWVFLDGHPYTVGVDGYWNSSGVWDDGGVWDSDGDPAVKAAVLSLIQKFKARHATLVEVVVPLSGQQWNRTWKWNDGSKWGGSSFRWKP